MNENGEWFQQLDCEKWVLLMSFARFDHEEWSKDGRVLLALVAGQQVGNEVGIPKVFVRLVGFEVVLCDVWLLGLRHNQWVHLHLRVGETDLVSVGEAGV